MSILPRLAASLFAGAGAASTVVVYNKAAKANKLGNNVPIFYSPGSLAKITGAFTAALTYTTFGLSPVVRMYVAGGVLVTASALAANIAVYTSQVESRKEFAAWKVEVMQAQVEPVLGNKD